jgi:putative sigma-54 modulation protein
MRINVVGRNIEVTEAIRTHAEGKAQKLLKYLDLVQEITVTVSKADHHKRGGFEAELIICVQHHEDFVVKGQHEDLYAAIDEAVHKGSREVSEYKERLKGEKR